jgi:holo-[acyl-carrier protein] synthase
MIVGIGVDIIEITRVDEINQKFGERFARRVLTADEFLEFERRKRSSNYLATRFAAKEAVAKACGTGIGEQLGFHSMQIENDASKPPTTWWKACRSAMPWFRCPMKNTTSWRWWCSNPDLLDAAHRLRCMVPGPRWLNRLFQGSIFRLELPKEWSRK